MLGMHFGFLDRQSVFFRHTALRAARRDHANTGKGLTRNGRGFRFSLAKMLVPY